MCSDWDLLFFLFLLFLFRCSQKRQQENGSWNDMISLLQVVPKIFNFSNNDGDYDGAVGPNIREL